MELIEIFEEESDWYYFSLSSAMKGLEDDNLPVYTMDDLKEKRKSEK